MLVSVLGEIPHQVAALQELYAALKPGGILSITEVIFDPHFQSRERVGRFLETIGFREKRFLLSAAGGAGRAGRQLAPAHPLAARILGAAGGIPRSRDRGVG